MKTAPALRLVPTPPPGTTSVEGVVLPKVALAVCEQSAAYHGSQGHVLPWAGYLALAGGACVGTCAFKGPPREGRVEIAYFTFPEHQGRGVATAMAAKLIEFAKAAMPSVTLAARTLPEESASTTVLTRLGFVRQGEVVDPDDGVVWEWQLPRV